MSALVENFVDERAIVQLRNAAVSFGEVPDRIDVLKDVDLTIARGEFVAIVGFSGTGKTTLINLLAGLLMPTSGEALCRGEAITGPGTDRGVVFQNYSLLPWLTVAGNVALAVDRLYADQPRDERRRIVEKYVEMVNLTPAMDKRPKELSGGMRQRVSVARALAANPEILLLDEPLSALDALTRAVLQDQIVEIWQREKKTVVLITNDVDEGIIMADRIIPLTIGPPATLGPTFPVDLPRPRDRKQMNHDPQFKRLRNDIIKYLNSEKSKQASQEVNQNYTLPDVEPIEQPNTIRGL